MIQSLSKSSPDNRKNVLIFYFALHNHVRYIGHCKLCIYLGAVVVLGLAWGLDFDLDSPATVCRESLSSFGS